MRALLLALALASAPAGALELEPFYRASPAAIARAHAGKPYVLVLWSLYCEPCREEMPQWGALRRRHPEVPIVLVSTDGPAERARVANFLAAQRLGGAQTWIFDDEFAERLRHAVDPAWRGELPRTYLVDRSGSRQATSGKLPARMLGQWMREQSRE